MGMYKFVKVKEITPQSDRHPDRELVAVKGTTGDPWTKKFYANNKDLLRQLSQFGKGDWMELQFSGKYNNLDSAGPGEEPERYEPNKPVQSNRGGGGGGQSARRSDGTSRGDDTNRSASIYLAKEVVNMANSPESLAAMSVGGILMDMTAAAEKIYAYITKGELFYAGIDPSEDALDPPDMDD